MLAGMLSNVSGGRPYRIGWVAVIKGVSVWGGVTTATLAKHGVPSGGRGVYLLRIC